jgi:Predicted membrane protein
MRRHALSWAYLALLAGGLHFLLTASFGLSRHWGYLSSIHDLGVFDQAVWGTLHGAPFLNTSNVFGLPINWLGFHFNPILIVFAPFYLVYPAAEWLILAQAAAVSITAWPLYLLGREVLRSERAAFLWAAAYLVNPFVLNAAVWDFHPVALAAPLMAVNVLAIEKRKAGLFGLGCAMLLLVQEHFGASVAGFAILWWLRNRTLAPAAIAFSMGVAHTILVLGVIMPGLSPTGSHVMMSGDLGQLSRYAWLGGSAGEIVHALVDNPVAILEKALFDMGGAAYLAFLLVPLLAMPLVGIEFLLPALADLSANLLSANPMPRSMLSYHSISLMPLLMAAGIVGSARVVTFWRKRSSDIVSMMVLIIGLLLGYFAAPLPFPHAYSTWQPRAWHLARDSRVSEVRRLLTPEASVSAQANVAAHFSQRERIYAFPARLGEADFIVLRLESPTRRPEGQDPGRVGSLAHHLGMPTKQYLSSVGRLLDDGAYGVALWNPPWLIFSKGEATSERAERLVRAQLANLEQEWNGSNR